MQMTVENPADLLNFPQIIEQNRVSRATVVMFYFGAIFKTEKSIILRVLAGRAEIN